ncbi:MAG: M48 family metalloprotease, partial [Candidatus Babeliales bacterium]
TKTAHCEKAKYPEINSISCLFALNSLCCLGYYFYNNTHKPLNAKTTIDSALLHQVELLKKNNYYEPSHDSQIYKLYQDIALKSFLDPKKGTLLINSETDHQKSSDSFTSNESDQFIIKLQQFDLNNKSTDWTSFVLAHELSHVKQHSLYATNSSLLLIPMCLLATLLPGAFTKEKKTLELLYITTGPLATAIGTSFHYYSKRQNEFDADLGAVQTLENTNGASEYFKFWIAIEDQFNKNQQAKQNVSSAIISSCYSFFSYPFSTHPSYQERLDFIKKHTD